MAAVKKWFKAKEYGYGWAPQTFEGWVATIIYFILIAFITIIFVMRLNDPLFNQWVSVGIYLTLTGIITTILVVIAYKTGEKPSWRWGKKKKNN